LTTDFLYTAKAELFFRLIVLDAPMQSLHAVR